MYTIENLGNYKIKNYEPHNICSDINGKRFVKGGFISSYNGRSGRTKMAIADVKMQTGWIPVCIERLIINKYNKLYMF